jgi:hypothetical protein
MVANNMLRDCEVAQKFLAQARITGLLIGYICNRLYLCVGHWLTSKQKALSSENCARVLTQNTEHRTLTYTESYTYILVSVVSLVSLISLSSLDSRFLFV